MTSMKSVALLVTLMLTAQSAQTLAAGGGAIVADPGAMQGKHFDPKGKAPSPQTVDLQNQRRKTLPFEDKRDFEESSKGFIAAPDYKTIMADAGNVAWDIGSYDFLLQGKDFNSIHPSLQRQAILNMGYGLYEVVVNAVDVTDALSLDQLGNRTADDAHRFTFDLLPAIIQT